MKQFRRAVQFDWDDLIFNSRQGFNNGEIPLIPTYQPHFQRINNILRYIQPILRDDPNLLSVFPQTPIISYRQPTDIRRLLVRSHPISTDGQGIGFISSCHVRSSMPCEVVFNEVIIRDRDLVSHTIRGDFSCSSSNNVYTIRCSKCSNVWYVVRISRYWNAEWIDTGPDWTNSQWFFQSGSTVLSFKTSQSYVRNRTK